jgi:hypothetical protein
VTEAAGNARDVWDLLRRRLGRNPNQRHHQLKCSLSTAMQNGRELALWRIEVTGGGRICYVFDETTHTVWIRFASLSHSKQTE